MASKEVTAKNETGQIQDQQYYEYGWLPLHVALHWEASDDIIEMLLNANPEAVKVQEYNYKRLPLHFAVEHKASVSVIKMLADAFPGSIFIKDKRGRLPLDLFKGENADI